jgi:PKD repeat protein
VTVVDPANDNDLWTIQEYASVPPVPAPISYWSTWWGRVVPDSGPSVPLPVAAFSSSATASTAGQPIAFSDTSTGATQWLWSFGDGTSSSARNPVHAFQYSGTFAVVLNAVNQAGATAATHAITVAPPDKMSPGPISRDRVPRPLTPRR